MQVPSTTHGSLLTALLGLKLETARALLLSQGVDETQITVRETAPPRPERASGDWRVLRCRMSGEGTYELLAAREQIHEHSHK